MEEQNQQQPEQPLQLPNSPVPPPHNAGGTRPIIPAAFGLAIVFFFFTFCDFRCMGQTIGSASGFELAMGAELKPGEQLLSGNGIFAEAMREAGESESAEQSKKMSPNIWAILALAAAAVGLTMFLVRGSNEALYGMIAGAAGAGALLLLQLLMNMSLKKESEGHLEASFQIGYWGALLAFALAGTVSFLRWRSPQSAPGPYA